MAVEHILDISSRLIVNQAALKLKRERLVPMRGIQAGADEVLVTLSPRHALFVALFLVVAHVAMIFGMLDPAVLQPGAAAAPSDGMGHMH